MLAGALTFASLVSASTYTVVRRQEATDTATTAAARISVAFESVTSCHFDGTAQYCLASGTEYRIVNEETGTVDQPASYTGCHNHGIDTYCFSPTENAEVQVLGAAETVAATTVATTGAETGAINKVTAVTDCHLSQSSVFCTADTTEYYAQMTITATADVPAQLTGCHSHDTEIYCVAENNEVQIIAVDDINSGQVDSGERHCHFHAGVEHCVGGDSEESEASCERVDRDYDISIRIGLLFAVLVASSIGVFGPILVSTFAPVKSNIFLIILRQFGTGVIVSTAFIHLFTHASLMFGNECLGELSYEGITAAILMAGLFISFAIEYGVQRTLRWQARKKSDPCETNLSSNAVAKAEMADITIMEAGIIFHSLLIGLTLVVAGDSFFITLAIVIIFHQMFEGIALGTRIAYLGHSNLTADLTRNGGPHPHMANVQFERSEPSRVSLFKKLCLATGFAIVTPIGMAIGIGVLNVFNGNDKSTLIAIGTLDALSAGILVWVGLIEMWGRDWIHGGELTDSNMLTTVLAMFGLISGMTLMSVLGKWA